MRAQTPVIDIDCDDPRIVDRLRAVLSDKYSATVFRHGRGCRVAVVFKTDAPFSKLKSAWLDQSGHEHRVEILGKGQQLVAYGHHPNTNLPYYWTDRDGSPVRLTSVVRDELPDLDREKACEVLSVFDDLAAARGWTRKGNDAASRNTENRIAASRPVDISFDDFSAAVMQVPKYDDYDRFVHMGMAIKHQTGGSDEGLELWERWASQSSKFQNGLCEEKWRGFNKDSPDPVLTARAVYHWAGLPPPRSALGIAEVSEDSVALAFAERHNAELRYDHQAGCWFRWDKSRWRPDETEAAFDYARQICRDIAAGEGSTKTRLDLARASTVGAVERFARSDRSFAVTSDIWDADPFLLGTPSGTVDLRTGVIRAASSSDFITMVTNISPLGEVDPARDMPVFWNLLKEVTSNEREVIAYLQRYFGYCLTGDTREQILLFVHGPGGNGKSLLQTVITEIFGSYAGQAPPEMFLAAKHDRHPTELAELRGKRMIMASENESGRQWAEVRIKQLTGGDPITARKMRQDFFTFKPSAKFLFTGNNKPALSNIDDAMRRRFHVLEFSFRPVSPDKTLLARIRPEMPAILRWIIEGCLLWQLSGLKLPSQMQRTTDEYFAEQDVVQEWLDTECELGDKFACSNSELRESFMQFASARPHGRERDLLGELRNKGFETIKNKSEIRGRGYRGLRIRQDNE